MEETTFEGLGLDPRILSALTALGYEEPTPIQREAIPALLAGRDLLGKAATGTGKTAAFALPMLERLAKLGDEDRGRDPTALVLVPTRELAMQVAEAIFRYGKAIGVRVLPVYGGQAIGRQLGALERGVDVVVATPGRALDHLRRETLSLASVGMVVLDEADEMLDMGFAEDLEAILGEVPEQRQTALFSATLPRQILAIAHRHLDDPAQIEIARELAVGEQPKVRQIAYIVDRAHKLAALGRVLDVEQPAAALIFCRTRIDVDELTETMSTRGYSTGALHGGMSQEQRDRVMRRFKMGASSLLIATDVAARGLDIKQLSHVINYEVPASAEDYVHRIGRTGRAGREGVAITLVTPREQRWLRSFERLSGQPIEIGRLPTVADLRAGQMELTCAAVRETLVEGDLDRFRAVVEKLGDEFDIVDIALAAVKLAHKATVGEREEQEIPSPRAHKPRTSERPDPRKKRWEERPERAAKPERAERPAKPDRAERPERAAKPERAERPERAAKPERAERAAKPERAEREDKRAAPKHGKKKPRQDAWPVARLFIGAGRDAGVGPNDLVGAIANESGLSASAIGAIEIADRHAIVEVPEEIADELVDVLRGATLRGRRFAVRRHQDRPRR